MGKRGLRRVPNVHAARACNARARIGVRSVDEVNGRWMSDAWPSLTAIHIDSLFLARGKRKRREMGRESGYRDS